MRSVLKKRKIFIVLVFLSWLAKVGKDTQDVIRQLKRKANDDKEKKVLAKTQKKFFLMKTPLKKKMNMEL